MYQVAVPSNPVQPTSEDQPSTTTPAYVAPAGLAPGTWFNPYTSTVAPTWLDIYNQSAPDLTEMGYSLNSLFNASPDDYSTLKQKNAIDQAYAEALDTYNRFHGGLGAPESDPNYGLSASAPVTSYAPLSTPQSTPTVASTSAAPPTWTDTYNQWFANEMLPSAQPYTSTQLDPTKFQKDASGYYIATPDAPVWSWTTGPDYWARKQDLDQRYISALDEYNKKYGTNIQPDQSVLGAVQPNPIYRAPDKGGWLQSTLQDLGPLPSIGLAIATGGASLEAQIAAQAALQVASGVPLDKAVTNAAGMYAGAQVVNIPAIKEAVGSLDNAALQNVAKGALSGATTAGVLGKDVGLNAMAGGLGGAVGSVVGNIAADQGLNKSQTNVLNASASVFARSMLAGASLEQAFQAAAMAGGMANAKSVVKGFKADKTAGIDIPDEFVNKVESGGIKLASADGSLPIEIGGVPIYAESSKASTVEPPFGYRLLSTQEADSKPQGSYYDITQNAWMAPDEEQMKGLSDLQSGLASGKYGEAGGAGYGNVVQGVPSDYGNIDVTAPRDSEIPEVVITDTREPAVVDATSTATQPSSTSTTSPISPLSKLAASGGGGASTGTTSTPPTGYIPPALKESLIKNKITGGKFQDPLKHLKDIQEAQLATENNMIQNGIDPQLAAILAARAVQSVDEPQTPHFTYGQEDSIDSILGKSDTGALDQAYAEGGYVQPLTLAPGGLAAPLMAASGGLPSKAGGREDFRTSKHVAGEGDGHSDDIPAMLADGEFVFSADVVSALGNGSTKAGSDKLYKMVEEIRKRARSTSPDKLAPPALKSPLDYLKKR